MIPPVVRLVHHCTPGASSLTLLGEGEKHLAKDNLCSASLRLGVICDCSYNGLPVWLLVGAVESTAG